IVTLDPHGGCQSTLISHPHPSTIQWPRSHATSACWRSSRRARKASARVVFVWARGWRRHHDEPLERDDHRSGAYGAREPHLLPQDHVWRELSGGAADRAVPLPREPALRLADRRCREPAQLPVLAYWNRNGSIETVLVEIRREMASPANRKLPQPPEGSMF
ncbi:unnamed protein product, partial [Mycena citricolor]